VLEAGSIEAIHIHAVDTVLNELAYESPAEMAKTVEKQIGLNPLECPAFQRYLEIRATRDVHIHNRGIANKTYIRKAGQYSRVKVGDHLPVDTQYFRESFEQCIQLTEWWEEQLHDKWHSSEHEARLKRGATVSEDSAAPITDSLSEELRQLAAKFSQPR
jgi:hypothetical protein